jgi:lipid A 3-O-deacylase
MHYLTLLALGLCSVAACAQNDSVKSIDEQSVKQASSEINQVIEADDSWSITDLRLRDYTLYWDNDGTLPRIGNDTDRFYTNGAGIELSFNPHLSEDLASRLAPSDKWTDPRFGVGLAIKQLVFTGRDITDPAPSISDHPYSGYLYLAFSFQRADEKKRDHFELDVGVVGERSQAEMIQRFIHNVFPDQDTPQGWGGQLANEMAINFNFERAWKSEPGEIEGVEFDMIPSAGFELGNVSTRAKGRITLRVGKELPDDFGPASLLGNKDHTVNASDWGSGDWSFYLYSTLGMDAVAHDIFLDGNTFATSRSVDSEPFVAMAMIGVVARYQSFYFGWSQTYQSEKYETQPSGQAWGTMMLGCSVDF